MEDARVNVLMLTSEYPPMVLGGLALHAAYLATALAAEGCRVTVVTARGLRNVPEVEEQGPITILRPPADLMTRSAGTRLLRENVAWVKAAHLEAERKGDFDVIHCQGWLPALAAIQLAELSGRPLVTTFHSTERALAAHRSEHRAAGSDFPEGVTWEEELLRVSAAVIAVSRALADEISALYKYRRPVNVVHNAVLPPPDGPRPERAAGRLLFVGRLVPQKGLEWMLEALATVRDLPFEIDIVGRDWGPQTYEAHLRALAERLGIADRVRFAGFLEPAAVEAKYREAGAVIVPSLYEPFGLVCVEAMRFGVPLIAARTGGVVEIVDDSTGQLVEPGNVAALGAAVRNLWDRRAELAARAERARALVSERFTWTAAARATLDVYRSVTRP